MTTEVTQGLIEFLRARYEKGEATADTVLFPLPGQYDKDWRADDLRSHAAWMFAQIEANRRIIDHCATMIRNARVATTSNVLFFASLVPEMTAIARQAEFILKTLALPYAGHPDYREEWRT
jgi:hypothetical protein